MAGNNCGHIIGSPRIFSSKKRTVFIFKKAVNRLADFYEQPNKYLKKLQFIMPNGRKRRSESREAIASITSVILNHTDLATKSIVKFTNKGVANSLTVSSIARMTGMSYRRCIRALRQLKKSEYITVNKIDSDYTVPRLKQIDTSLLTDLHVKHSEIEQTKNYYYKRNGLPTINFSDLKKFEDQRLVFNNKNKWKQGAKKQIERKYVETFVPSKSEKPKETQCIRQLFGNVLPSLSSSKKPELPPRIMEEKKIPTKQEQSEDIKNTLAMLAKKAQEAQDRINQKKLAQITTIE